MAVSTAAAIIGGSVIGGALGIKGGKDAAKASAQGQEKGIAEQRRQFDITQKNLQPSLEAGNLAREQQLGLLGLNGEEEQQEAFDSFNASPGQKFLRDRAQKNLVRNASVIGGIGGGNVRSALVEQGVGFAQQDIQNRFGRLGQVAGQGQSAATNIGQFGQNTANKIQQGQVNIGEARSSGITNKTNAIQNAFQGVLGGFSQGGAFSGGNGQTLPAANINPFSRAA